MTDTLFTALVSACRRFGRATPAQWEDQKPATYSYGDLLKTTLALARLMQKVTQPGEHVGVLMPNLTATVGLMIGLSASGRVPCMLNYTAGAEAMRNACGVAGVKTVVASHLFIKKAGLEEQVAALGDLRVLYLEDLHARFGLADKIWLMGIALWFPLSVMPEIDPEAPAVVLFTSGSEGKPKGVVLSHRALLANVAQITEVFDVGPRDTLFNCLPIFHAMGLTAGVLLPMVSGMRLVLYTSPLHFKEIPKLIREKQATAMFASSTFLAHYARNAEPDDLKSLRFVVAGAEKLAEPVRKLWKDKFGVEVLEGYGATETAPVLAVNRANANRPGTVGTLLPRIEARIVPVPGIDQGGELHVRGPNLLTGYYLPANPGQLSPPWSELGLGWYNLGDIVTQSEDGYLSIQGRLKRFAKIAGEMVSLEITEAIARAARPDAMHAAISVADPGRGEAIILFTTDAQLAKDMLVAAARERGLPELALPRRIQVLDALPVLGTGKVDYVRLKGMTEATATA